MSGYFPRMLFFVLTAASALFGIIRQNVDVPLSYNYLPGEPFWAKYGSTDDRTIQLWVSPSPQDNLGSFVIDDAERYVLIPQGRIENYLDKAVSKVLTHYGVTFSQTGTYRLYITPLTLAITSADGDGDGTKQCKINLLLELYSPGPTSEALVTALVSNDGSEDIDDSDELGYADLLDRTLHGAIVKIWGSQILNTDKPLGPGIIRKVDRGSYTFYSDSTILSNPGTQSAETSQYSSSRYYPVTLFETAPASNYGTLPGSVIKGATGNDTVIVTSGRRISAGILPFENGTGNEHLTALIKSAQEQFAFTLSRSGTIKVLERGKLSDVLKEQALGLSGIMNDSTVVKVGNLSGLQVMIAGEVTTTGSYYRMSARIINVETSAIVASASVRIADALRIAEAGAELAATLLFKFTEEKMEVNRNSMPYPSIAPRAVPATTAAIEDAWAVEYNPAAIMKVTMRDVAFYTTFAEKISGTAPDGEKVSTGQPPYATMGLNCAYPVNGFFGTGFGIRHQYNYPRLLASTEQSDYDYREEETQLILPVAFGITPQLSFGASVTAHIAEFITRQSGTPSVSGNSITTDITAGTLVKLSERFRMGATYTSATLYEKTDQTVSGGQSGLIDRPAAHYFRIGTAMYPVRWFFFFGDLLYQKYSHLSQAYPGFNLGMQFTAYGRPEILHFLPEYGMIPFYLGYSHEPWDGVKINQAKYFSFGSGYYLNNMYLQWSWRMNVEPKSERNVLLGDREYGIRLQEYRYRAPLFLCVGYRF